jgi:hypothetical protein
MLLPRTNRAHEIGLHVERLDNVTRLGRDRVPKGAENSGCGCRLVKERRSNKASEAPEGHRCKDKWHAALREFLANWFRAPGREGRVDDTGGERRIVSRPRCGLDISCVVDDCAFAPAGQQG